VSRNEFLAARIPGALLAALALLALAPLGGSDAGRPAGGSGAVLVVAAGLAALLLACTCRLAARPPALVTGARLRPGAGPAAALDGAAARQLDPDAPGHVRPRAPGRRPA
jgi:Family of unknown function (DUF6412)